MFIRVTFNTSDVKIMKLLYYPSEIIYYIKVNYII